MASVVTEEPDMTEDEFRAELRRIIAEVDGIRARYNEPDENAAQREAEKAEWRKEMAESHAQIEASLARMEAMRFGL